MKPKGIIGEQIEKAVGEVGAAVSPLKVAEEVVRAVTGGKVSGQNFPKLAPEEVEKRNTAEEREKAFWRRVIEKEKEGLRRRTSAAIPKEARLPTVRFQGRSPEEKPKEMPIISLPAGLKRRLPRQKPVKGRAEIKDFSKG